MDTVVRVVLIYLVVALVSGGIAILGNQLGRKIGRRKMSVFNMRPKHTSIFITTLTGIFIALATLSLAIAFSQDIREAVTGRQLRLQALEARERELNERVEALGKLIQKGTIVWRYNEPIILTTLLADTQSSEVEEDVNRILRMANVLSVRKNNQLAYATRETPIPLDTQLVEYDPDEVAQLAQALAGGQEAVGVRVVAAENCLLGDAVPVRLESFPVERIFQEGEVVSELQLDPDNALVGWYEFLERMKLTALRRGMLEVNDSLGGGITADELRRIQNDVLSRSGPFRLVAVANRDLFESSSLDVRIEVRAAGMAGPAGGGPQQ